MVLKLSTGRLEGSLAGGRQGGAGLATDHEVAAWHRQAHAHDIPHRVTMQPAIGNRHRHPDRAHPIAILGELLGRVPKVPEVGLGECYTAPSDLDRGFRHWTPLFFPARLRLLACDQAVEVDPTPR
jgi:hypothetical protein